MVLNGGTNKTPPNPCIKPKPKRNDPKGGRRARKKEQSRCAHATNTLSVLRKTKAVLRNTYKKHRTKGVGGGCGGSAPGREVVGYGVMGKRVGGGGGGGGVGVVTHNLASRSQPQGYARPNIKKPNHTSRNASSRFRGPITRPKNIASQAYFTTSGKIGKYNSSKKWARNPEGGIAGFEAVRRRRHSTNKKPT